MKYMAISVEANAGQYYECCKSAAQALHGDVLDELPKGGKIVCTTIIKTWGLPTWAYTFYVKAPQQ